MKTNAGPPHLLEDGLEAIPEQSLRGQHLPVHGLEQESFLAVANIIVQHFGERRVQVNVPDCCWRLECVRDVTTPLAALLSDEQRAPVVRDVLLNAQREKLGYSDIGPGQQCGSNSVSALRARDDMGDFIRRERGAVLLSFVDLREADK